MKNEIILTRNVCLEPASQDDDDEDVYAGKNNTNTYLMNDE